MARLKAGPKASVSRLLRRACRRPVRRDEVGVVDRCAADPPGIVAFWWARIVPYMPLSKTSTIGS